jgi:hypothetical protein
MLSRLLPALSLAALLASPLAAADAPPNAKIFYSAAPWDGAAYAIQIPLAKSAQAPNPVIKIDIWGNPEFLVQTKLKFTGKEDPGGGPARGKGRALYQSQLDLSSPQNLSGTVVFKKLKKGKLVEGAIDLKTLDGKLTFKSSFRAAWANEPPKTIR